jgi:tetratricopeptide (TPR) repeat protein
MWCQVCGASNSDDAEFCARCQHKLLVISGAIDDAEEIDAGGEESFSFDEHLLERISILEEVVKRTGETVRSMLNALHKQEENILVNHAGLATVRELLERKGVVDTEEWDGLWESKLQGQLLALERRDRFVRRRENIAALYNGDRRPAFERQLEEAEHAFFALDVERAMSALESAFKLDRENHELALFLGESHFHDGGTERALEYFRVVLELKPDHYEGLVYRGVIHHQRGESERAEECLRRAVTLYPDAFLPQFTLGAISARRGQLSKAVAFLEQAVAIDAVPEALYLLGSCCYEMGQLKPAIAALSEAIRADPTFEDCYHLLGLCYLDRHWNRKALEAFRQAQRLNPKRMRYEELVSYLSGRGVEAMPGVGAAAGRWLQEAESRLRAGSARDALKLYRQALVEEPDNPTLLMSYALVCLQLDRSQETRALTQRVIDLRPGEMLTATAYATLIASLRIEGKYREGNRVGRRLLDEGSSDFTRTIAYYEMAYNYAEMDENLDEALELARRSLHCSPAELKQFPLAALGWVHYKRREFDQAVDFLSRSTELGANSTTMTHLGMALLAAGEEQRARSVLDQARRLGDRGALEEKMMELMRDSAKLQERVRRK